jgi:hypothetical protein
MRGIYNLQSKSASLKFFDSVGTCSGCCSFPFLVSIADPDFDSFTNKIFNECETKYFRQMCLPVLHISVLVNNKNKKNLGTGPTKKATLETVSFPKSCFTLNVEDRKIY